MGDNRHHCIAIEAIGPGEPDTKYPWFVDGTCRCRPEDVGGTPGYENFVDAIADPNHEEHVEVLEWYGAL